jgi:hypothetical protein
MYSIQGGKSMNDELEEYQTYLLRLWRTCTSGRWQWRASIENPHTGERQTFADVEQCFDFLRAMCDEDTGTKRHAEREKG